MTKRNDNTTSHQTFRSTAMLEGRLHHARDIRSAYLKTVLDRAIQNVAKTFKVSPHCLPRRAV